MGLPAVGLVSPFDTEDITGRVVTFSAQYTDPVDNLVASVFTIEIDTTSSFNSGNKITATLTNAAHNTTHLAAAALDEGTWYYRASATNADGTTTTAAWSFTVAHPTFKRALYQYENIAKYGPDWLKKRALYQYENVAKYGPDWLKKRGLYQYENITDEPPFPHIERLSTTRTSQGSVVTVYGNGFGAKAASDPANADRAARGYGGAVYLGTKQCGIVSWSWQEITFTVPVDAVSGAVFVRLTTPEPPGQRDSSLKGLEIYEAPPTTDTGLELFVCDKNHPNTILAQLDAATEKSFYCQRNASGSGMFRISRLDAKGGDRALVTDQNYILCRLNGVDVFKWIIESRKPAYVDDSEEQWIDVSGRGNMAVLDQAIVYPEGMPYPESLERTWADTHGAAIFLQLFNEAKTRGCFPYVTVDFTADHDSLGMPWDDLTDVSFHTGTKLSKVAEKLSSTMGLFDLYMTPTFILRAYKAPGRGVDLSDNVRFFKGQSILSHENQSDSTNIENVIMVEGDAGSIVEVTHTLTPSVDTYGRREGYLQARNIPDDWTQLANYGKIKADKSGQVAWGIRMATDFAYHKPFDTYNLGDWIWVHIEPEGSDAVGFDGKVRVVGVTVTEDEDLKLGAQLELNNIMLEREILMAQLVERLSQGSTDAQMTNPSETPPAGIAHNHFHALLLGLEDDDHPQYYNALRHADDPHSALARVTSIKKQGSDAMTGDVTLVAGSNVTLTQDTGAKTIKIAASGGGGGGWPDRILFPADGGLDLDDEFDDDTLGDAWVSVFKPGFEAVYIEKNGVLSAYNPGGEGGYVVKGLLKPIPVGLEPPFYIETAIRAYSISQNYPAVGVMFATGTAYGAGSQVVASYCQSNYYTQLTAWTNFNNRTALSERSTHAGAKGPFVYIRLVWTAAGKFKCYMSGDGITWFDYLGEKSFAITPTYMGILTNGHSCGEPWGSTWEYFRVREGLSVNG